MRGKRMRTKRISKIIGLFLIVCIVFAGCGRAEGVEVSENNVQPKNLTEEQIQVINSASGMGLSLFYLSYNIPREFSDFKVWAEIYERGTLCREPISLHTMKEREWDVGQSTGDIVIGYQQISDMECSIGLEMDGTLQTHRMSLPLEGRDLLSAAGSAVGEKLLVTGNQDFVLYYIIFAGDSLGVLDPQKAVEDLSVLQPYEYAILIKASFSV